VRASANTPEAITYLFDWELKVNEEEVFVVYFYKIMCQTENNERFTNDIL